MNKKIIGIIAALLVIIAAIIVIAMMGNKLEEIKLPLQIDFLERTVSAIVGYPKDVGIVVEDMQWDTEKVLKNETENYKLEVRIVEDTTYDYNKEYYSKKEGYEEVQFNDFTGYIVKGKYDFKIRLLLEDLSNNNADVYLSMVFKPIKNDNTDINALYQLKRSTKNLKFN